MKTILFYLLILLSATSSWAENAFQDGNNAFREGHFQEAITAYEKAVKNGDTSANLFYNLGNAFFRNNEPGMAALNYERALLLNSAHKEARANLSVIRNTFHSHILKRSFPVVLPANSVSYATALAIWIFLASVIVLFINYRKWHPYFLVLLIVTLLIALTGTFYLWKLPSPDTTAIVTASDAKAFYAPTTTAKTIGIIPPGSEVTMLDPSPEWNYIELPDGQRGWISSDNVKRILPL